MEECRLEGSDCSDHAEPTSEGEDEDGLGGIMADVLSTAAAARNDTAHALDAAAGIAFTSGTAEKPVNHCRAEEMLFVESYVPASLVPAILPEDGVLMQSSCAQLLQRLLEAVADEEGKLLSEAIEDYPLILKKPRHRWRGVEASCPVYVCCNPLQLFILRGDFDGVQSLLDSASELMVPTKLF
eukprot:scaffold200191_cov51-Prasinocladus_malaysianus.AAC.1